jgi:hypothetical protein
MLICVVSIVPDAASVVAAAWDGRYTWKYQYPPPPSTASTTTMSRIRRVVMFAS